MNVKENAWNKAILIERWTEIYSEYFNRETNFSEDLIPHWFDSSRHFAVLVAEDLELYEVIEAIESECGFGFLVHMPGDNLNILYELEDMRETSSDYCVIFNAANPVRYDNNLPDCDDIETIREKGITLIERLLLELFSCDNNAVHLDEIPNKTICGGSIITDEEAISNYNKKFDEEYDVVPTVEYNPSVGIRVNLMSLGSYSHTGQHHPNIGVRTFLFYKD